MGLGDWLTRRWRRQWDQQWDDTLARVRADMLARGEDPDAPGEPGPPGVQGPRGVDGEPGVDATRPS